MEEREKRIEFTSALSKRETLLAAVGLVMHTAVLPLILAEALRRGLLTDEEANFAAYGVMAVYTVAVLHGFLRRDFDALADRFFYNIFEVLAGYFALMCFNLAVNSLLLVFFELNNPNTESVNELVAEGGGMVRATVIFLSPIVEEVLFRGLLFGSVRKYSRIAAYVFSVAAFAVYHLWSFILLDAGNLIYLVQYIPAGILLCRCYERTNTIWAPMALHALVNAVSLI